MRPYLHMLVLGYFRFAARQLHKSPGFTLTVLLTLGLCIGANTAIFSVVDSVFFRPLPLPQPDRLIMAVTASPHGGAVNTGQDGRQWEVIRDHATVIEPAVFPGGAGGVNLAAAGHVEFVQQQRVSAGFFHVLGIPPLIGREFTRAEDITGGPNLTILSNRLWRRIFRGDPGIVGRTVDLRGAPYTVIGVMPPGFRTDAPVDLWTPVHASRQGEGEGTNFEIIGRLKPGVTLAQATGQLAAITHPILNEIKLPDGGRLQERAIPLQEGLGSHLRPKVKLLWAAVGLVLLIGCVNIAGILLSRSAVRSREIATRLAIGASRAKVITQLLAESALLALGGGLLGIVLGQLALKGLLALNPDEFASWTGIHLNLRVMAIMLLVSIATSFLFGLFPAWQATAIDLRSALAEAGRGSSRGGKKWREALVFAEIALGVVLVIAAGLLVRTFSKLAGQKPGFNGDHVITASLSLQDARYQTSSAGARLFRDSLDRIQEIPGVESAAVALSLPYQRPLNMFVQDVAGGDVARRQGITNMTYITPWFFRVLEIPLLRGRLLADSDRANSAKVAVVNEAFVHRYFRGGGQPLGSQIRLGDVSWQIVGVVDNVPEQNGWGADMGPLDMFAEVYVPADQFPSGLFSMVNTWFSPNWIVRTHGTVAGLPDAMGHALQAIDPTLPFSSFRSMPEIRGASLAEQRYQAVLFSSLAALAILLAALGVYGLVAQSLVQRTREMGIRLALGASAQNVVRTIAATGIYLAVVGIAAGLVLGLFVTRFLKSMIWGISTTDPTTLVSVALLLLLVAALASFIPAMRLLRLDPAQTLREE